MNTTENDFYRSRGLRSFAVVSGKGGTGKSLIAASLGYVLAHCGLKTLLVDTDIYTSGLTFYLVGDRPFLSNFSMLQAIQDQKTISDEFSSGILLKDHIFCRDNLFLIPSVPTLRVRSTEVEMFPKVTEDVVKQIIGGILKTAFQPQGFDFIIFDTRGGTELITIESALLSDGYVIVTEGDKTSWDACELLIDIIDKKRLPSEIPRGIPAGFILNKNVLYPTDAVERFLKRSLRSPHLATIPLDMEAIKSFQKDEVPLEKKPEIDFSLKVIEVAEELFNPEYSRWPERPLNLWQELKYDALRYKKIREYRSKIIERTRSVTFITKLFLFFFSVGLFYYLGPHKGTVYTPYTPILLGVFLGLLAFSILSDVPFLSNLLRLLFRPKF